jgi:hypothetical protein
MCQTIEERVKNRKKLKGNQKNKSNKIDLPKEVVYGQLNPICDNETPGFVCGVIPEHEEYFPINPDHGLSCDFGNTSYGLANNHTSLKRRHEGQWRNSTQKFQKKEKEKKKKNKALKRKNSYAEIPPPPPSAPKLTILEDQRESFSEPKPQLDPLDEYLNQMFDYLDGALKQSKNEDPNELYLDQISYCNGIDFRYLDSWPR